MTGISRRDVIKAQAVAAAAAAAGLPVPALAQNLTTDAALTGLRWAKAPCRFCGTGCSVMVATKNGRVVATHGDAEAEVNRGLNCVKGYFLSKIMYGQDRLTQPLLRMRDGEYAKDGDFAPITWDQAFDIMAEKWKATLQAKGPQAVGMFGSGQWTIFEGYAASKLMKAGFRSNNLDPNARHCMASAVTGFMRTFGIDEPMGCYDDIEHADAFVLWGANMSEMHPILWTRITDRRFSYPHVKVAVLSTFRNRSFDLADIPIVFKPQSDLAIMNYIANHIIETGAVNEAFVADFVNFKHGNENIGYGLRPENPLEQAAEHAKDANDAQPISFEEYAAFVAPYTLDRAAEMSGVEKSRLQALAEIYAAPDVKVMSTWTMGFNQHTRGTWANNLCYNLHLLTGKISTPGNSPFSLTGQPSACGTAREVGTFAHRLPADLQVTNPEHRAHAEEIWKLPPGTIPDWIGSHAVQQNRDLKDGKINVYWVQVNNNIQAAANLMEEGLPGYRNPDNFIIVSDVYPTSTCEAADLILPAAMWVEKEGGYGNAERRTQFWRQMVTAPGRVEVRPLAARRVLEALHRRGGLAARAHHHRLRRQDPLRRALRQRPGRRLPAHRRRPRIRQRRVRRLRLLHPEGPVRGIRHLRPRPRPRPRAVRPLPPGPRPALAGRRRQGDPLALQSRVRPLRRGRQALPLLRPPGWARGDLRAALRAAGREPGRGIPVLARHRPGARALALRLDDPAGARALPRRSRRALLHAPRRRGRAQPPPRLGRAHRLAPRRDGDPRRDPRPQPAAARAGLRALVRRPPAHQQGHARRHLPHLQADGLQEVRRSPRSGVRCMMQRILALVALLAATAALAQDGGLVTLRQGTPLDQETTPPPIPSVVNSDIRQVRNWPEQPPVIPHQIDNYQIDLNVNKCLTCHSRTAVAVSQAPMVSITHFQNREGQALAAVTPRRFFCTQCHVPQMDVQPVVGNTFEDVDTVIHMNPTSGTP